MMMKENLPANKGKSEVLKEIVERGEGRIPKKGGYYEPAPGKFEADAYRVQEEANEKNISVRIISVKQTAEYSEAIVEAIPEDGPAIPAVVHHDFETIFNQKVMEMFKKQWAGKMITFGDYKHRKRIEVFNDKDNPFIHTKDGKMIPNLTGIGLAKVFDDMLRFKNFSLRDATTKAIRVAQLKALNKEWREDDEIKSEEQEVKDVNKGKDVNKVGQEEVDKKEEVKRKNAEKAEEKDKEEKTQDKTVEQKEEKKENTQQKGKKSKVDAEYEFNKETGEYEKIVDSGRIGNKEEKDKPIKIEEPDSSDDLTRKECKELEPEQIGLWAVKKIRSEEKEPSGAELGRILMPYVRKRWISNRRFEMVKEWFMEKYMK
jgi:hypothetical protein